ncbi:MAG: hypothetical protein L6422_10525 [Candidatus Marinimicrobia bacterium]|nr:hypothetical protein [bacterium]MCG2716689.1 hypothetical protein [Candidatus Neomarinimicrobiota bacterium]
MKNIKEQFLKNLKEINSAFDHTTDRSKELTLLMTLYLMGESNKQQSYNKPTEESFIQLSIRIKGGYVFG